MNRQEELSPGDVLAEHRIEGEAGRGGMADDTTPPADTANASRRFALRRRVAIRLKRQLVIAGAAVALLLGVGGAALALTADEVEDRTRRADAVALRDAVAGRLAATISVGARPDALVIAGGRLWVASQEETRLRLIDITTNKPVLSAPEVGVGAAALDAGFGSVWIAKASTQMLMEYSIERARRIGAPIALPPGSAVSVAAGVGGVWVASRSGREGFEPQTVARIDPRTTALAGSARIQPDGVQDLTVGDGAVWVLASARPIVTRIDADTDATERFLIGGDPQRIALGQGAVWISNSDGSVSRIGLKSLDIRRIPVGREPRGIAVGSGAVWVANSLDGTATRIDPKTGDIVGEPVRIGGNPSAVTVRGTSAWFSLPAENAVARVDFKP